MPPGAPPPTGVIHRFGLFIEGLKRAVAEAVGRNRDTLGPMAVLLWSYLARTMRRLAALHARFEAGTLGAVRRHGTAPRPVADRPALEPRRLPPRLPSGPVLAQFRVGHFYAVLQHLVDDPEMRSLLAASPQAGRLLRPLWRMLTPDPLPEALRPPPRQPERLPTPGPDAAQAAPPPGTPPAPPTSRAPPAKPPQHPIYRPPWLLPA